MSDAQATGNQPAGWYPEPGSNRLRWWDGTQWGVYQEDAAVPATPAAPMGQPMGQPAASANNSAQMAMLTQVLGIFTGFLGPLIMYVVYGEKDPFVKHHAAEALNFQITLFIGYVVSVVLMFILIGFITFFVVWIGGLVFCVMAAIAANKGEWYRYPINIRLISGAQG